MSAGRSHHLESAQAVVTPGNYDGVHLGHRALLGEARRLANLGQPPLRVVAMTFDPHPTHFVNPERAPPLLTTPARRAELLREAGADHVEIVRFDESFCALEPTAFVHDILIARLSARAVVVGEDFRFGAQRAGDVRLLEQLGAPYGLRVITMPAVTLDGRLVSSSQIRAALAAGDVALAARMLTRVHDVERRVVRGDQRGRTLGFPTANLELSGMMPPADGVYAVAVRILDAEGLPDGMLWGVANLGVRPTLRAGRSMEVHILDFDGDLYERRLRVGFVARLRGEQKFSGLDALKAQIAKDVETGRAALVACDPRLLSWM